jgi:hypothetical protein
MINIAVVKTARRVGIKIGILIDEEDRRILAQGLVLAGAVAFIAITLAASLGLAVRVFQIAAG